MSNTPKTDALCRYMADKKWIDHSRELERENARLRGTLRAIWEASPPPHPGWPMEYRKAWADACKEAESFFTANIGGDTPRAKPKVVSSASG